ncbi:glycosyltransferase [bacterium]|nr:glycosyltransferase [bacterium]
MKNLLLVSYFFPPHGGAGVLRPLETVRLLEGLGWRCSVVAGPAEGYWFSDPELLERVPASAEVRRTRAWSGPRLLRRGSAGPRRNEALIGRLRRVADWLPLPDVYCGWVPFAVHAAMELARKADCILSTSPPESAHCVAGYVARRTGLPWVADFRDPWLHGLYRCYPSRWQRAWQAGYEARAVRHASLVIANTPEAEEDFRVRYPGLPKAKFQTVPNGFDPEEFSRLTRPQPQPGVFRLVHAGGLTLERDPLPFVRAFARVRETLSGRLRLVLELIGPLAPRFLEQARGLGLGPDLELPGWVGRRTALERLAAADCGVLIEAFRAGAELVTPLKLYDYLGAGLPVLAVAPAGAATRTVESLDAGLAVTSPDEDAIAAALEALIERVRSGGETLRGRIRAAASGFERGRQVERLAGLIEHMLP